MNLLEIIFNYLDHKTKEEADAFLKHLVKDAGMPKALVKHIQLCWDRCKATHSGAFLDTGGDDDVNLWLVKIYYPEMALEASQNTIASYRTSRRSSGIERNQRKEK